MTMKTCDRCKISKDLNLFYENPHGNKYRNICKACSAIVNKERAIVRENSRSSLTLPKTKVCGNCKSEKPLEMFYKSVTNKYGRMKNCKECDNSRRDSWRDENRERVNNTNQDYRKSDPERRRRTDKEDRRKHPEKHKGYRTKFRRNNPGKINAKTAKRRAQKLQATPKWLTKEQKQEIQAIYIEAARLTRETGIKHHVDHIIPLLGKGVRGLHVPWNLQILTAEDNMKKGNKILPNLITEV